MEQSQENGRSITRTELRALGDLSTRLGIAAKLGETYEGDRDLYQALGYRRDPEFEHYLSYYLRGDIAAKVIDLAPQATWRHAPTIQSENEEFVEQIEEMDDRLRLFHFMERIDEISGIGEFGVLLIGTRGTKITEDPGKLDGPEDIVYVRAYHQGSVEIEKFDEDTTSSRYGKPTVYKINLAGTTTSVATQGRTTKGSSTTTSSTSSAELIPWQRVIHVAEHLIEDDVHGQPRLARVLNRVDDLFKVLGGSAELYWQNIGGVWHADISPDVKVADGDPAKFEDDILAARHGLTRLIQTRGVTLNTVAGVPTDPSGTYQALKEAISAGASIPERVLFGSERGQLAGDQDQKEWQARIAARQELHAEPVVLRATLDRFITLGALVDPKKYDVDWPPLDAPSTEDRAITAEKFAKAIAALAPAGASDLVMPIWEIRSLLLGLDPIPPPMPKGFEAAVGFTLEGDDDGDGDGDGDGERLQESDEEDD